MKRDKREIQIKKIESYLRAYETYKLGIINLQKQLDYIMPNVTASYELREGSTGTFNIKSDTEKYAIDRIESKKALIIHEDIERYKIIINSIDEAMKGLNDIERDFIKYRYFKRQQINQIMDTLGYSEKYIFTIRNHIMNKLLISLKGLLQF